MKRLSKNGGFTLVEMLVATLVLALIAGAIIVGMRATSTVFWKYDFAASSDTLASTVNDALRDVLRYSAYDGLSNGSAVFTNDEYNVSSGAIMISSDGTNASDSGKLYIVDGSGAKALVNVGGYDSLAIENFSMSYSGGLYSGSYTITDGDESKDIDFAFRTLK
jgi:prepilin-type N-terminal cleavage/methylation domain-containing protein